MEQTQAAVQSVQEPSASEDGGLSQRGGGGSQGAAGGSQGVGGGAQEGGLAVTPLPTAPHQDNGSIKRQKYRRSNRRLNLDDEDEEHEELKFLMSSGVQRQQAMFARGVKD